jgi:outer membrane protein, adhesin transport system
MLRGVKTGFWLAASFAAAFACSSAVAETIESTIATAISHSPDVQGLRATAEAAGFGREAAKGLDAPRVSLNANAGMSSDLDASSDSWNASVSATQSIYDSGYRRSEQEKSSFEEQSAYSQLLNQSLLTGLQAVQTYLEVQRSRGLVRILTANQVRLRSLRQKVSARVAAGVASEVELYDADAQLDAAELNLLDAKSQLADAVVSYRILTGRKPGNLASETVPDKRLPKNEHEAVSLALHYSPSILAVKYDALAAASSAKSARASLGPQIDLNLSAGRRGDFRDQLEDSNDISAQISFRFDLYDGGTGEARANQAHMQAEAARSRAKATAREIEKQLRLSWNTIHLAGDRRRVLLSQLKNARKSLRLNIARYEAGIARLSDLLDLNSQVASAEAAWLNSEFTHRYNVYRVLAATGRLLPKHSTKNSMAGLQ